ESLAISPQSDDSFRQTALKSATAIDGKAMRGTIEKLTASGQPQTLRYLGVVALTEVNLREAASRAATVLQDGKDGDDLQPLMTAFFDQKAGPKELTAALASRTPSKDVARLMLRGMYAIGRSDPALVDLLQKAAGISADIKPV